jgi:hypothetical protein
VVPSATVTAAGVKSGVFLVSLANGSGTGNILFQQLPLVSVETDVDPSLRPFAAGIREIAVPVQAFPLGNQAAAYPSIVQGLGGLRD